MGDGAQHGGHGGAELACFLYQLLGSVAGHVLEGFKEKISHQQKRNKIDGVFEGVFKKMGDKLEHPLLTALCQACFAQAVQHRLRGVDAYVMVLDNMLVELLQLTAIDRGKIPALFALQEEVHVFRGVGKKTVTNAGCAFDAGAGDDALFFKTLKVAIHRGGSHFGALVGQGACDIFAGEKSTLVCLDA